VPVVDPEGDLRGVVTEADLLLEQEHPDLELNVPRPGAGAAAWSGRRPPRSSPAN
jgi:hypothetical protein